MRSTFLNIGNLSRSVALPAGGATAASPAVDFGGGAWPDTNLLAAVDAPALNTTQLPDGETITYNLIGTNGSGAVSTVLLGTQTGAGGAGAAAATFAARVTNLTGGRYVGLQIVASAGAAVGLIGATLYFGAIAPA